jgi:hypothetical protein
LVAGLGRWLFGGREQEEEGMVVGGLELGSNSQARSCCGEDFFIVKRGAVPVYDARFWSEAYTFSSSSCSGGGGGCSRGEDQREREVDDTDEAGDRGSSSSSSSQVACPSFLQPLAFEILTAGKSLRLLRHVQQDKVEQEVSAAVPSTGIPVSSSSSSSSSSPWKRLRPAFHGRYLGTTVAGRGSFTSGTRGGHGVSVPMGGRGAAGMGRAAEGPAAGEVQQRRRWGSTAGAQPEPAVGFTALVPRLDGLSETLRLRLAIAAATAGQQQEEDGLQQLFLERALDLLELSGCCGVLDTEGKWQGLGVQELEVLYAAQAGVGREFGSGELGQGLEAWRALQARIVLSGSFGAQPCNTLFAAEELKRLSRAVVAAAAAAEDAAESQAYESAVGGSGGAGDGGAGAAEGAAEGATGAAAGASAGAAQSRPPGPRELLEEGLNAETKLGRDVGQEEGVVAMIGGVGGVDEGITMDELRVTVGTDCSTAATVASALIDSNAGAMAAGGPVKGDGEGSAGVVDLVTWLADMQNCTLPDHKSAVPPPAAAAGGTLGKKGAIPAGNHHHLHHHHQHQQQNGQQQEEGGMRQDPYGLKRLGRVQRVPWLRQANAQADELGWLLEHSPDNMVCVEELLQQALLHPIKQRVSRVIRQCISLKGNIQRKGQRGPGNSRRGARSNR